jgi:hypothetical protein
VSEKKGSNKRTGGFMAIIVRLIGPEGLHADNAGSGATNVYRVVDNGREFTITFKSHSHGGSIGLAGQRGFLYVDDETHTVRRQVITVGNSCGVNVESDEAVEGLSPRAIRGVVMAERSKEKGEISLPEGLVLVPDGLRFFEV